MRAGARLPAAIMMDWSERRKHPRYAVRWKAAALLGQRHIQEIHHGHTLDVSIGGVSILCDHDMCSDATEDILVLLFPVSPRFRKEYRPIEICGRLMHATPSTGMGGSRLHIAFTGFRHDAGHMLAGLLAGNPLMAAI